MARPTVAQMRAIPCDWCGAAPGESCRRPNGSKIKAVHHAPREDAWWARAQRQEMAVRSHVPILIDGLPVLIPIADADQIMRAIAAAVWPELHADPS